MKMNTEYKPTILKYSITSNSPEEFSKLQEAVEALPEKIKDQIESVKKFTLGGPQCRMKQIYSDTKRVTLPNAVNNITITDDTISVWCNGYYFEIPRTDKAVLELNFIETKKSI